MPPLLLLLALLCSLTHAATAQPGPLRADAATGKPSSGDPTCVWFTLQDNLPAETVQLITYGAPEMSAYLALSLTGDTASRPQPGNVVTAHYALFLDDCTFIESSRHAAGAQQNLKKR